MAQFEIVNEQGMRSVHVRMENESVRVEAGALAYLRGAITMATPLPGLGAFIRASLSDESAVRPVYSGTGELFLASSVGGYYAFEVEDEHWIISAGAYWASEGSVEVGVHREGTGVSFWSGQGFVDFKTELKGHGKAVLSSTGPVEEIEIAAGEEIRVEGPLVIGRTAGTRYAFRRPTRSWLRSRLSGEQSQFVFGGPGKVLLCSTPYWNSYMLSRLKA